MTHPHPHEHAPHADDRGLVQVPSDPQAQVRYLTQRLSAQIEETASLYGAVQHLGMENEQLRAQIRDLQQAAVQRPAQSLALDDEPEVTPQVAHRG